MAHKKVQEQINDKVVHSAIQSALAKAGISTRADVERVFGEASKALTSLKELEEKAASLMDSATIKSVAEELRSRAEEDALILQKLEKTVKEIEKIPGWEASFFASQHKEARALFDEIVGKNPFSREALNNLREKERLERKKKWLEDVKKLREGTISLHEALATKPETFFIAVRAIVLDERFPGGKKEGWLRLEGRSKGDRVEARVVDATHNAKFLLRYSFDPRGRKTWVVLSPPDFITKEADKPYFHPAVREALASLYAFEEERLQERARITATPQDILDGKDGLTIVFHKQWQDFKTGRVGPVKLELESKGGKIRVLKVESSVHDWRDLVDEEFGLPSLDRRVKKLLQIAAKYQQKQEEQEENSSTEAE